jgi:hypothetical protein
MVYLRKGGRRFESYTAHHFALKWGFSFCEMG